MVFRALFSFTLRLSLLCSLFSAPAYAIFEPQCIGGPNSSHYQFKSLSLTSSSWPGLLLPSSFSNDFVLTKHTSALELNQIAQRVIRDLVGDDPRAVLGISPRIGIFKSPTPNAFALAPNTIVLSSGLMEIINTESELAYVLSHELAHLILKHSSSTKHTPQALAPNSLNSQIQHEVEADLYAFQLLASTRYHGITAARNLLLKLEAASQRSFPSIAARLSLLNANQQILKAEAKTP